LLGTPFLSGGKFLVVKLADFTVKQTFVRMVAEDLKHLEKDHVFFLVIKLLKHLDIEVVKVKI